MNYPRRTGQSTKKIHAAIGHCLSSENSTEVAILYNSADLARMKAKICRDVLTSYGITIRHHPDQVGTVQWEGLGRGYRTIRFLYPTSCVVGMNHASYYEDASIWDLTDPNHPIWKLRTDLDVQVSHNKGGS